MIMASDNCICIDNLVFLGKIGVPSDKGAHRMEQNTDKTKRKEKGGGSVYFNEERDCWIAQFSINVNGQRIRKSAAGATESEALKKLESKKRKELANGRLEKPTRLTLGQAMDKLLESIQGVVADSTYCEYSYRAALVKEYPVAKVKLDRIDTVLLQQTLNQLVADRNIGASTCEKVVKFIKRTYRFAVQNRYTSFNPVQASNSIRVPKNVRKEKNVLPLSSADCDAIRDALEHERRLRPIVYCMLYAGLRLAEALALTWDDISFDESIIFVKKAVTQYPNTDERMPKHYFAFGPTKTNNTRTVAIDDSLKACLSCWKDEQDRYAKDKTGLNLVFPNSQGRIQNIRCFSHSFTNFLNKAGLDASIYHSRVFRHTYASYAVKLDIKVKTLQEILGHANSATTLKYYVDIDSDTHRDAAKKIGNALDNLDKFKFVNINKTA